MQNTNSTPNFNESYNSIDSLKNEWSEELEIFTQAKDAIKNGDIFDELNYLAICDNVKKNIYNYLKQLGDSKKTLMHLKKNNHSNSEQTADILNDLEEFKVGLIKILNSIDEEYPEFSEMTLRKAQDMISSFSNALQTEKITPSLRTEISQNLDKDVFLQEIKDSLESYREAREELVSETPPVFLRTPDGHIPEDVGEEYPEYDTILSQLDTIITACDAAILTQDIGE